MGMSGLLRKAGETGLSKNKAERAVPSRNQASIGRYLSSQREGLYLLCSTLLPNT